MKFIFYSVFFVNVSWGADLIPLISSFTNKTQYADTSEVKQVLISRVQYLNTEMSQFLDLHGIFNDWGLRTIAVGLGVKMEVGVSDLSLGINPKIRTVFIKKGKKPIYP